jgi:hypothetical protein
VRAATARARTTTSGSRGKVDRRRAITARSAPRLRLFLLNEILNELAHPLFGPREPAFTDRLADGVQTASLRAERFEHRFGRKHTAAKAGLMGLGRTLSLEGAKTASDQLPYADRALARAEIPLHVPLGNDRRPQGDRPAAADSPGGTTERPVRLPTHLASGACTVSGESFSVGGGRYARVFVGVTDGWMSERTLI